MKKLFLILAIGIISVVNSCKCKKHEDPQPAPATTTSPKSVQYRVEEGTFENDAPVSTSVEQDGGGNAFIVIRYNPKYIKPVVGYPNFQTKPVIGYPAFADAYALQSGVDNNACLSQALVLVSKSASYVGSADGLCEYIKDLKKLAQECSTAKAQLDPLINTLNSFSTCK